MREVIRGYRLKVKAIETEAEGLIDAQFGRSAFDVSGLGERVIVVIRPHVKQALQEGATFGQYVRGKMGRGA